MPMVRILALSFPKALLSFALLCVPFSYALARVSFVGLQAVEVGNYPLSVVADDFNGDGKIDLAVVNEGQGSYSVSILLGFGDGTFLSQQVFPSGVSPVSVATADFNGDGTPDLAVASLASGLCYVLLGTGTGSFFPAMPHATGGVNERVATGDFNGDGKQDFVTTLVSQNAVSISYGNGDGTFQPFLTAFAGSSPQAVAIGDMDANSVPEFVVADYASNSVAILYYVPSKDAYLVRGGRAVGQGPLGLVVGDFNGDGRLDFATSNFDASTVSVNIADGAGSYSGPTDYVTGQSPFAIGMGDFNRDGSKDLCVTNNVDGTVSVLEGRGNGLFGLQQVFAVQPNLYGLVVADINGDGQLDIAAVGGPSSAAGSVTILLNDLIFQAGFQ